MVQLAAILQGLRQGERGLSRCGEGAVECLVCSQLNFLNTGFTGRPIR